MPLNMNTIGTGNGIGGGANSGTFVVHDKHDTLSSDFHNATITDCELTGVAFYDYIRDYPGANYAHSAPVLYDRYREYVYGIQWNDSVASGCLTRVPVTCASDGSTGWVSETTQLVSTIKYVTHVRVVGNFLLIIASATSNSDTAMRLYSVDVDNDSATDLLGYNLYDLFPSRYNNNSARLYITPSLKTDNDGSVYFAVSSFYSYNNNYYPLLAVFKLSESGGITLLSNSTSTGTAVTYSYTYPGKIEGLSAFFTKTYSWGSRILSVMYDQTSCETVLNIAMTYGYHTVSYYYSDRFNPTIIHEIGKITISSSGSIVYTQIKKDSYWQFPTSCDYQTLWIFPISSSYRDTFLVLPLYENYYKPYIEVAYYLTLNDSTEEFTQINSFQPFAAYDSNYWWYSGNEEVVFSDWTDHPSIIFSYRQSSDDGRSSSRIGIVPINISMDSYASEKSIYVYSAYFSKGDVIRCDAGILSYTLNDIEVTLDNIPIFKIPNSGNYKFVSRVHDAFQKPDFIIYTNEGTIMNCNVKFIDDTTIEGTFNVGMKINGTVVTEPGYQKITGDFYDRRIIIEAPQ